jgi:hypothetical protein
MTPNVPSIFPRSLFLLWSACTLGLAVKSPTSLTAVLASRAGAVGDVAALVFGVAFFVLLLDMFVHEVLPTKFTIKLARDYRWLWVSSMSTVYWMFGTLALLPGASPQGSWVLITSYFCVGAWGMTFAFNTKLARYRNELAVHHESQNSQLA